MNLLLPQTAAEQLFSSARTHRHWLETPVSVETLHNLYETSKWAPTSLNSQPGRYLFLTSAEAKARLIPSLMETNVQKAQSAPVTVILASDSRFYEYLPKQYPAMDVRPIFEGNGALARETAFRNSSMQAGYFILAARALGLDCGPMSGFSLDAVNQEFFPDGRYQVNLLINLGYGDHSQVYPRGPRLAFDETCQIL